MTVRETCMMGSVSPSIRNDESAIWHLAGSPIKVNLSIRAVIHLIQFQHVSVCKGTERVLQNCFLNHLRTVTREFLTGLVLVPPFAELLYCTFLKMDTSIRSLGNSLNSTPVAFF